jgi:hypothetical protein
MNWRNILIVAVVAGVAGALCDRIVDRIFPPR